MNEENQDNPDTVKDMDHSGELDREEQTIRGFLTVAIPLIVAFTAFFVIVLAYSQWKLF